jgi:hypothetical protein
MIIFNTMAKAKKKRADKYDTKLAINASFDEIIKVSTEPYTPRDKKAVNPKKTANKKGK